MEHLAAHGIACPLPVHGRDGEALRTLAGKPAAIISFLDGMWPRRIDRRALRRRSARRWPRCTWPARDFALEAAQRAVGRRLAAAVRRLRAGRHDRAGLARRARGRARLLRGATGPRDLPSGVIHADLFPDNVFFLRRPAVRAHRLLFRLQRSPAPTTSRSASTPGASSRTARSTSPRRAALLQGYRQACGRSRRPSRGAAAAGARRGAALPADPALRLAAPRRRRAGQAKDPREYCASCASTAACVGLARLRAVSDAPPTRAGRDLHRRRLQRQSRPGRLGRDPAPGRQASASCPAASPRPPTTAWS